MKYRDLKIGEEIIEGDEFECNFKINKIGDNKWLKSENWRLKNIEDKLVGKYDLPYRRPIKPKKVRSKK